MLQPADSWNDLKYFAASRILATQRSGEKAAEDAGRRSGVRDSASTLLVVVLGKISMNNVNDCQINSFLHFDNRDHLLPCLCRHVDPRCIFDIRSDICVYAEAEVASFSVSTKFD